MFCIVQLKIFHIVLKKQIGRKRTVFLDSFLGFGKRSSFCFFQNDGKYSSSVPATFEALFGKEEKKIWYKSFDL